MTLEIASKKINIDTDAIGEAIYQMHVDNGKAGIVAFGMIDAHIIGAFEKELDARLKKEFSPEDLELFSGRIEDYKNKVTKAVTVQIYATAKSRGKMIV
jgi:hypothetical protein